MKSPLKSLNVGWHLLNRLQSFGVDHIFGIPGDYVIRFDKQIEDHPIQFINTTREDTAGYMADAYSRVKGLGVACITYGVGINIVNAIAQGFVEGSPLVVISGAAAKEETTKHPMLHHLINKSCSVYRDTTQLEIFKQVTIGQEVIENPKCATKQIDRLLHLCLEKKKPVYIELPRDIVEAPLDSIESTIPAQCESDPTALAEALDEVDQILQSSERPFIWAGKDLFSYGLTDSLLAFAEARQIPIASTLLGKTVVSEKHPLSLGVYQGGLSQKKTSKFIETCDCTIVLGVILSDVDTGFFTVKLDLAKQIIANHTGVTIGRHKYSNVLFKDFVRGLGHIQFSRKYTHCPTPTQKKKDFIPSRHKKISVARLFECLNSSLTHEHIVVPDIGDALFASSDLLLDHQSFLASAYFAALGSGIPMALGAQFASSGRRTVAIIGDGAFQMTGMELSTAIRYHLDPVVIILNNHGYGTERPLIDGEFNNLLDWNYTAIPAVLGSGIGIRITTEEECDAAISTAFNSRGKLHILEVELDQLDFSPALLRFKDLAKERI